MSERIRHWSVVGSKRCGTRAEQTIDELFAAHGIGYGLGDSKRRSKGPPESNHSSETCEARYRIST